MTRKKKKTKKLIIVVFLIIGIIFFLKITNKPNQNFNEKTIVLLNNQDITKTLEEEIKLNNSKIFMSFNDVKNFLDNLLYYEEESSLIISTGNKKLAAFKKDDSKIIINGSYRDCSNMVLIDNEKIYINISELRDVYNYEINYIKDSNIITIDYLNKKAVNATLKKNTVVKKDEKNLSKTIDKLKKGNEVLVLSEENSKLKIRTKNGNIGYIKKSTIENYKTIRDDYIEDKNNFPDEGYLKYDIAKKDISNFTKRLNIINLILQQAVKNDNIYVKVLNKNATNSEYERFKIESKPMLEECGIIIDFD